MAMAFSFVGMPVLALGFTGVLTTVGLPREFVLVLQLMPESLQLPPGVQLVASALWSLLLVYPIVLKVPMQVNFGRFRFAVLREE